MLKLPEAEMKQIMEILKMEQRKAKESDKALLAAKDKLQLASGSFVQAEEKAKKSIIRAHELAASQEDLEQSEELLKNL
jgi:hypothetical protein